MPALRSLHVVMYSLGGSSSSNNNNNNSNSSAQVRAYDDRAQCRNLGIPYKGAFALSSHALTYVALKRVGNGHAKTAARKRDGRDRDTEKSREREGVM